MNGRTHTQRRVARIALWVVAAPVVLPSLLIVVLWWKVDDWIAGDGYYRTPALRRDPSKETSLAA